MWLAILLFVVRDSATIFVLLFFGRRSPHAHKEVSGQRSFRIKGFGYDTV